MMGGCEDRGEAREDLKERCLKSFFPKDPALAGEFSGPVISTVREDVLIAWGRAAREFGDS